MKISILLVTLKWKRLIARKKWCEKVFGFLPREVMWDRCAAPSSGPSCFCSSENSIWLRNWTIAWFFLPKPQKQALWYEQMFTEQFLLLTITMSLSLLVGVSEKNARLRLQKYTPYPGRAGLDFMLSLLVDGSDEQTGWAYIHHGKS